MPTTKKRVALTLDSTMENKLYELRKTDEYCRCSLSEILRRLLADKLRDEGRTPPPPTDIAI